MPESQTAPRGDLGNVIDMDPIRGAKISLGVDPLGGADVYRGPIGNGCSLGPHGHEPRRGSKAGVVRSFM
jgi:hypothetical protein